MKTMTNDEARITNARRGKACLAPTRTTRLFLRRRAQAAFSLIEILIAMFVFLVGVLGVLSIFPVAMQSAGRSTGEVRATILAQNVLAQMNADCQAAYSRGDCAANGGAVNGLRRLTGGPGGMGHFVTLTKGPGKWQSRLIWNEVGDTMSVVPDWTPVGTWTGPGDPDWPDKTDSYVVTRMGLPLSTSPLGVRSGYIRRIVGDTIYAGIQNTAVTPPQVNALPLGSSCDRPGAVLGTTPATGGGASWVERASAGWVPQAYRGKLVVLTRDGTLDGPAVGQVRWITDNTDSRLNVYPDWNAATLPGNWALVDLEIYDSLGYFLVITSGRASGRVFPISDSQPDGAGDRITCGGVDFSRLSVKAAERGTDHPLSNADSFAVIGGPSTLLTACPIVSVAAVYPSYVFNSFGRRNTADRQVGADLYVRDAGEKEASDFGVVAILSAEEGSADAAHAGAPVRADVFIFRNYDSAKSPRDNQRALGYMTGYIGRPKP